MNPKDKIHSSWQPFIDELLASDDSMITLNSDVLPNTSYLPDVENIFNVFQMPLQGIKVVILGQDPYPTPGNAIGYAFAVSEETNMPASLRIIEKEVGHKIDKTLLKWREQGVFLLNTALTVQTNKAGSHLDYWKNFTSKIISHISQHNPCVWVLWGKKAQDFRANITKPSITVMNALPDYKEGFNYILQSPHPAAEAYSGGTAGFLGCGHFEKINEILGQQQREKIIW